jgi:hypothetical protein
MVATRATELSRHSTTFASSSPARALPGTQTEATAEFAEIAEKNRKAPVTTKLTLCALGDLSG